MPDPTVLRIDVNNALNNSLTFRFGSGVLLGGVEGIRTRHGDRIQYHGRRGARPYQETA